MPDWDAIPGARGCTPQACYIRDHARRPAGRRRRPRVRPVHPDHGVPAGGRAAAAPAVPAAVRRRPGADRGRCGCPTFEAAGQVAAAPAHPGARRRRRSRTPSTRCSRRTRTPRRCWRGCARTRGRARRCWSSARRWSTSWCAPSATARHRRSSARRRQPGERRDRAGPARATTCAFATRLGDDADGALVRAALAADGVRLARRLAVPLADVDRHRDPGRLRLGHATCSTWCGTCRRWTSSRAEHVHTGSIGADAGAGRGRRAGRRARRRTRPARRRPTTRTCARRSWAAPTTSAPGVEALVAGERRRQGQRGGPRVALRPGSS